MIENTRKAEIKSNWLRILTFFGFLFLSTILFTIPLVAIFWGEFQSDRENFLKENILYLTLSQMAFASATVATIYFMATQIEFKNLKDYRITFDFKALLIGLLSGTAIMVLFASIASGFGLVSFQFVGYHNEIAASFILYLFVAITEELVVRGYVLTNLQEKMNTVWALIFSSLFFGAVHFWNDHFSWIGFSTIALSGFLMGILLLQTRSISSAIGLHWSWNFIQGPIFGFAVSGHQEKGIFENRSLVDNIYTGGDFGAEGSILLALMVLVIAVTTYVLVAKYINRDLPSQISM